MKIKRLMLLVALLITIGATQIYARHKKKTTTTTTCTKDEISKKKSDSTKMDATHDKRASHVDASSGATKKSKK